MDEAECGKEEVDAQFQLLRNSQVHYISCKG